MPKIRKIIIIIIILTIWMVFFGCKEELKNGKEQEQEQEIVFLGPNTTVNDIESEEYSLFFENGYVSLFINENTTSIKLLNKASGYYWHSDRKTVQGTETSPSFIFSYTDINGNIQHMNSMRDSVEKGQYDIKKISNGIEVKYSLGDIDEIYLVPVVVEKERFESFLDKMEPSQKTRINSLYVMIDLSMHDANRRAELALQYPEARKHPIYTLRNRNLPKNLMITVDEIFYSVGYTEDDLFYDHEVNEVEIVDVKPRFNVTIQYIIEDSDLIVVIPKDRIYYDDRFPIESIQVLPYFASASTKDEGYFLLPDGSGSIMNFYNGKDYLQRYRVRIYGQDKSLYINEKVNNIPQAIFPVYGMKKGDNAFIGIIEDSDSLATINALPGSSSLTARAWPEFSVLSIGRLEAITLNPNPSQREYFDIHQQEKYTGDIRIRYAFLINEDANFSGMARHLRDIKFNNVNQKANNGYPLYANFISTIDRKENILFFNYDKKVVISEFSDIADAALEIKDLGIDEISIILSGWFNGGYRQGYAKNISIEREAGGKDGFENLSNILKENEIKIFPAVDFQYSYNNSFFPGLSELNIRRDVSRYLVRKVGILHRYDLAYFSFDLSSKPRYIMNPEAISNAVEGFLRQMNNGLVDGLYLTSIGKDINADYNNRRFIERQEAMHKLLSDTEKIRNSMDSLIINTGNFPFVDHTKTILELSPLSGQYDITDHCVPFSQIVLSGNVNYTSYPINLSNNNEIDMLNIILSNSAPYYVFSTQRDPLMYKSDLNNYYSILFDDWFDNLKTTYEYLHDALADVYGYKMYSCEIPQKYVYIITYENGIELAVNFNDYIVEFDDMKIEPRSYTKRYGNEVN